MQICTVCLVWFLPESPRALVELNRYEEAENAIRHIAWWTNRQSDVTPGLLNSVDEIVNAPSQDSNDYGMNNTPTTKTKNSSS